MVNLLTSLNTATEALRVSQYGMGIVGSNIANMNTEGYSKQRLDQKTVSYGHQLIGSVDIDRVLRYQDEFLNTFMMQENCSYQYESKFAEGLTNLETYFNDADGSGLVGAFQDYFSAAATLAGDPTNQVARSNFVVSADTVAKEFNKKFNQLTTYRENLVGDGSSTTSVKSSEIYNMTQTLNKKLEEVAILNLEISHFTVGDASKPNILLDQRQSLIDEISSYIPLTVKQESDVLNLSIGNVSLVSSGEQVGFFEVGFTAPPENINNPATVTLSDKDGNKLIQNYATEYPTAKGSIKAVLDLASNGATGIKSAIDTLDNLAKEFAREVNAIQLKTEIDPDTGKTKATLKLNSTTGKLEVATENIFLNDDNSALYDPDLITSGNIRINKAVLSNPSEIATAYDFVTGTPPVPEKPDAVGNNNNALLFSQMRDIKLSALGNQTVEKGLYSLAAEIGNNSALQQSKLETQELSLNQLKEKRQSITGVSLDEELVDLLKYQRAYQASGQVFSTINTMLDVIINMVS